MPRLKRFRTPLTRSKTAGGGTLYIPATGVADSYFLRPDLVRVENITVMGEGSNASTLTGYGPCFITAKHPTRWDCGHVIHRRRHIGYGHGQDWRHRHEPRTVRMDLTEFMSGGTYPPGGGRPCPCVSTGLWILRSSHTPERDGADIHNRRSPAAKTTADRISSRSGRQNRVEFHFTSTRRRSSVPSRGWKSSEA